MSVCIETICTIAGSAAEYSAVEWEAAERDHDKD